MADGVFNSTLGIKVDGKILSNQKTAKGRKNPVILLKIHPSKKGAFGPSIYMVGAANLFWVIPLLHFSCEKIRPDKSTA